MLHFLIIGIVIGFGIYTGAMLSVLFMDFIDSLRRDLPLYYYKLKKRFR